MQNILFIVSIIMLFLTGIVLTVFPVLISEIANHLEEMGWLSKGYLPKGYFTSETFHTMTRLVGIVAIIMAVSVAFSIKLR